MNGHSHNRSTAVMRQSLFAEGIVDGQFAVLEQLHRDNPNFIEEVVSVYFNDSTPLLSTLEKEMNTVPTDFSKMERILYRLKGRSANIGARKIRNEIKKTRALLRGQNLEGARVAFQDVQNEFDSLKTKLEPYFQQLRYVDPADTNSPPR